MLATSTPFPSYFGLDGHPLSGGFIYFGKAGMDAETNPVPIFWDAAGEIPAAQPVRTVSGYTVRGGAARNVYVAGDYSIAVRDRNRALVYSAPSSAEFDNDTAQQAQLDAIFPDLANSTDPAKGPSRLSFSPSLPYAARTTGATLQDDGQHAMRWLSAAERAQVKAGTAVVDLSTKLNAAKADNVRRPVHLAAGTWSLASTDLRASYGGLHGDGMVSTTIKARSIVPTQIDIGETSDVIVSPIVARDLTLDGDGKAAVGATINLRHHYVLENVQFTGHTDVGLKERDTWLGRTRNVRITAVPIGRRMVGSNHASVSVGDGITNCSNTHLLIESFGTANDGNEALSFFGLVVADGAGIGVDDGATSSAFYCCYLGENIGKTVFINRLGTAIVDGGTFYFGSTPATYAFSPVGGLIVARGVRFNGQSSASTMLLVGNVGTGKIRFEGCQFNFITGGNPLMQDDPLGYGPQYPCFAPKGPKAYAVTATNCTVTTTDNANLRTFTVTAAAAGTKTINVHAALVDPGEWIEGPAYIVITYRSTIDLNVRLSGGVGGTLPLRPLATLPATAGNLRTLVKLDGTLDGGAYTTIEIYSDSAVVGASLELTSVHLSDSRMPLGNLWKC